MMCTEGVAMALPALFQLGQVLTASWSRFLRGDAAIASFSWTSLCLRLAEVHGSALQSGARGSGMVAFLGNFAVTYWMGTTMWIYAMPMLLDLVGCLVYNCPWFNIPVLCIFAWAILWAMQFPLWLQVFETRVPVVAQLFFWLVSVLYPVALRIAVGTAHAASLPSGRLRELYKKLRPSLVRLGQESALGMIGLRFFEWVLFVTYLATRTEEFLQAHPWNLAIAAGILGLDTVRVAAGTLLHRDPFARRAWALTYCGFHSADERGAASSECDVHEVCGICLDRLCMPITDVPAVSCATSRRHAPGLAACRVRSASPGRTAGLAAMRCRPQEELSSNDRYPWTNRIATLPCGHQFHALCMRRCAETAVRKRACPMCRTEYALGDATEEIEEILLEDEVLLDYSHTFLCGFCVLVVFLAASIFTCFRPSTLWRSVVVVVFTMALSVGLGLVGYLPLMEIADDLSDEESFEADYVIDDMN